jgi:hypothetical protein
MIIWAIAALMLSAVSIYVLLLKKNIRVAGIATGAGILLPLFIVAGNCIIDSHSTSCALGKVYFPYFFTASLMTFTPLLYLLVTVLLYQHGKRRRRYGYRYRNGNERVRFDNQRVYYSNTAGRRTSMSWRQIREIRIARTVQEPGATAFDWELVGKDESRPLRIGGGSNGIERLTAHIKQLPGFDHNSFSLAMGTTSTGSHLIWMRN